MSGVSLTAPEIRLGESRMQTEAKVDWEEMRRLTLRPGGFGAERVAIWPKLLHVEDVHPAPDPSRAAAPHGDEHQIRLDTDRSFVLYPAEEAKDDRVQLQAKLYELIVAVFHDHPGLNYFQNPEWVLDYGRIPVRQELSRRLNDLTRLTSLPLPPKSWLVRRVRRRTEFLISDYQNLRRKREAGYHDIVTVFFLTLPPELQLPAVEKMSLHRLRDAMGKTLEPMTGMLRILQRLLRLADAGFADILEEQMPVPFAALSHVMTLFAHDVPTLALVQHVFDYVLARPPIAVVYLAAVIMLTHRDEVAMLEREGEEGMIHSVLTSLPSLIDGDEAESLKETLTLTEALDAHVRQSSEMQHEDQHWPLDLDIPYPDTPPASLAPEIDAESRTLSEPPTSLSFELPANYSPSSIALPLSRPITPPPSPPRRPKRPPQSLSALLRKADDLMAAYPPSHPDLRLDATFGPASVIRTWHEDPALLPSDAAAEQMVLAAVDIVYPDEPEPAPEPPEPFEDEKHPSGLRHRRRRSDDHDPEKEKRRRRRLHRRTQRVFGVPVERRTMLAGAAVVLGVAMAVTVYGSTRAGGGHGRLGLAGLAGAGERLLNAFSGGGHGFGF